MAGYPYYSDSDSINNNNYLSDTLCQNPRIVFYASLVVFLSSNPVLAVDGLLTAGEMAGAGQQNRTLKAIAALGALDMVVCKKAYTCIAEPIKTKVTEKVASQPAPIIATIICAAAIGVCFRGVAERLVNQHL